VASQSGPTLRWAVKAGATFFQEDG
jgi:hypothetical protein